MTYERSYTVCIRPVLGCGDPRQPFDIKAIYSIFPTLDHAFAEARTAGLVGLYRLHKHCQKPKNKMGKKLPPQEMKLYRQMDEILHYMWDPIGVAGIAQARDEYHSYLPQVFQLVFKSETKERIASYLVDIEVNRMGLTPNKEAALKIAEILINTKEAIIDDGF